MVALTGALLLSGCGRAMPSAPVVGYTSGTAIASRHGVTPSLETLEQQATEMVRTTYPNCELYSVRGTRNDQEMVDAGSYASWRFSLIDDTTAPQNTLYVTYEHGKFSTPVLKKGFEYGYRLSGFSNPVELRQAIALLNKAGFHQDFRYTDLFQPVNTYYTEGYYVFVSAGAIVTVGATSGDVSQQQSTDWYRKAPAPLAD